jgi:hypothetical protein
VALEASRAPEQYQQEAGRKRIQRSGVAGLDPALAADPLDRVVRGDPGRLVDQQDSRRLGLSGQLWAEISEQTYSTTWG